MSLLRASGRGSVGDVAGGGPRDQVIGSVVELEQPAELAELVRTSFHYDEHEKLHCSCPLSCETPGNPCRLAARVHAYLFGKNRDVPRADRVSHMLDLMRTQAGLGPDEQP